MFNVLQKMVKIRFFSQVEKNEGTVINLKTGDKWNKEMLNASYSINTGDTFTVPGTHDNYTWLLPGNALLSARTIVVNVGGNYSLFVKDNNCGSVSSTTCN